MGSLHLLELPYAQPLVVVAVVAVVVDDVHVLAVPHLVLVVQGRDDQALDSLVDSNIV